VPSDHARVAGARAPLLARCAKQILKEVTMQIRTNAALGVALAALAGGAGPRAVADGNQNPNANANPSASAPQDANANPNASANPAKCPPKPKAKAAEVPKGVDEKADALLKKMSNTLASTKRFEVDVAHTMEAVTKKGQKLQFAAESEVAVERPAKLKTDRLGPIADTQFLYDGKQITVYGKRAKLYAQAPAPKTLDKTIDFAREKFDLDAPGADLLYSDPYKILMEDAVSGKYLGMEPIGDRMCHHLAYRGHDTDWQIWVQDGAEALPCRFVITSKKVEGQPQFSMTFRRWNLSPSFSADEFVFSPPKDAMQIDFKPTPKPEQTSGDENQQSSMNEPQKGQTP
jgi:hypothetical protein